MIVIDTKNGGSVKMKNVIARDIDTEMIIAGTIDDEMIIAETNTAETTIAGTTIAGMTIAGTTTAGMTIAETTIAGTTIAGMIIDAKTANRVTRDKDNDAMIWFLLKPVRANFEKILSTTKENVKSSKERASIFGSELVAIGGFLDEQFSHSAANEALKNNFWDFLAALWPVDDTSNSVTGKRLSNMYRTLHVRNAASGSSTARTNGAGSSR
ncbi:hypothetical protein ACCO45_001212 [Purpureocillium lilacinum]|uniref:Uncharacterized protein n=1 Tax=Purpureocillium lilacinum TaxID=33203 RepID=A0ACC4E9K2_PURLI